MPETQNNSQNPAPAQQNKEEGIKTPQVFISYSHDSASHKRWVTDLASRLIKDAHIDVILDLWDANAGDDLGIFMENSVSTSDYVVMVCSEIYTQKVNEGVGGAGYEGGIIRAELIEQFGKNKFIPIIPPNVQHFGLPLCVRSKKAVSFNTPEEEEDSFKALVAAIRQLPPPGKPHLGMSEDLRRQEQKLYSQLPALDMAQSNVTKPFDFETWVLSIIHNNDIGEWQKQIRNLKQEAFKLLQDFRNDSECKRKIGDEKDAIGMALDATFCFSKLFSFVLCGIESCNESFRHQAALIADIININNWNLSGETIYIALPDTIVFMYHNIAGAMAVSTGQFDLAFEMAMFKLVRRNRTEMVMECPPICGYEESIHLNFVNGINLLSQYKCKAAWLNCFFETSDDFYAALAAYNLLGVFCAIILKPLKPNEQYDHNPWVVPPSFLFVVDDRTRILCKQLIMNNRQQIQDFMFKKKCPEQQFIYSWKCYFKSWSESSTLFAYNLRSSTIFFKDMANVIIDEAGYRK